MMAMPTSSLTCGWNYDVTLSYTEEEETTGMNNFIGKLYASLKKANFKTFKDYNPERGEQMMISDALKKGIEGSRCAVIIFSRNFASSTRCLEEVALMMECRNKFCQTVFPVFLMDVEGSHVRNQKGSFEDPFRRHEKFFESNPEVVKRWRKALKIAGELSGLNFKDIPDRDDEKLIATIVKDVSGVLSEIPPPNAVIEMYTDPIVENQPSTQRMLQRILVCIGDPKIEIIGLYGIGGAGKTTLAREVNNHFQKELVSGRKIPFEIVIMVTVSATPNMSGIQTAIGKRLGLALSKDSEDDARDKLFDVLKRKKFLLILDDVWSQLKIEDVGIPHPRKHKGSKILVISRSKDACTDTGATETMTVNRLSEDESWNLFVEVAGQHIVVAGIECFAQKIVERCHGLPLAIVTVANAMTNRREVRSWENALREMEQSSSELRGMKEAVFAPLKFSFDRLENDMLKSLFLYFACFPEDYEIRFDQQFGFSKKVFGGHEMSNYCVGEGLVDKQGSLKAARDKGVDLIESLKITCMLEEGTTKGTVKMHDMMRDLALWITSSTYSDSSSSPKFLVRFRAEDAPLANEWVDVTRISLLGSKIVELTELGETCRNLTTLLLRWSTQLSVIPSTNFFQHMNHLSILDLSHTKLECLPNSMSCLENLRVLNLRCCRFLVRLPPLGMLRRLQVLDLNRCIRLRTIILGPNDKGCERNLRYLDVESSKVSIHQEATFSDMHMLEEVGLHEASMIKWRVNAEDYKREEEEEEEEEEEDLVERRRFIDVEELLRLKYLRRLSIQFEDIRISEEWFSLLADKITRLSLTRCRMTWRVQDAITASKNLEHIDIQSCPDVISMCMGATYTKLSDCQELIVLFDPGTACDDDEDSYRSLILAYLPNLVSIYACVTSVSNFGRLSHITIWGCNNLDMVFTKRMPRLFNNLDCLTVESCNKMEVIIEAVEEEEEEEEEDGEFVGGVVISPFPNLKKLGLKKLPALRDLCSCNYILHCSRITEVVVEECPMLNKDPLNIRTADFVLVEMKGNKWEKKRKYKDTIDDVSFLST